MKYKLWIDTGHAGAGYTDVVEFDEALSDAEMEDIARDFMISHIEHGCSLIDEGDDESGV